jgi:hypothetical protein
MVALTDRSRHTEQRQWRIFMKHLLHFFMIIFALQSVILSATADEWIPCEVLIKLYPEVLSEISGNRYEMAEHVKADLIASGAVSWTPVFRHSQERCDLDRWFIIRTDDRKSELLLQKELDSFNYIETTSLNYILYPHEIPNDPDYDMQYAWDLMEGPAAWDVIKGHSDIVVAIIDSGTQLDHEDLADSIWYNTNESPDSGVDEDVNGYINDYRGWDFRNNDNDPGNGHIDNMHGTHVAGIVGAVSNNGKGIAGGTWGCQIMILKVFADTPGGGASANHVAEALRYAADNGAHVANLSLGSAYNIPVQTEAVLYAYQHGVTILASSGNGEPDGIGTDTPHYPSGNEGAFGVGSTNKFDMKDGSSNYGNDWVDFYAPGVAIRSTLPGNQYGNASGTSMAAPAASALAALVLSQNPGFTPDEVVERMKQGCESIDDMNPAYRGALEPGRLNFYFSLAETPVLRIDRWIVDDSSGNGNYEADAGETVNLSLYVKNHSWKNATDVTATLSAGAGVTIIEASADYGPIESKATGKNIGDFTFTVTETDQIHIPFTLEITAAGGYSNTVNFDLSVNNPIPVLPGFPAPSFGGYRASPRAADINNDGVLDIITASDDGTINVFNMDGTWLPGWPRFVGHRNHMHSVLILSAPAVADLNGDGSLEIIVADQMTELDFINPNKPEEGTKERRLGRIHVFNSDGTDFDGSWPYSTDTPFVPSGTPPIDAGFRAAPTAADVTGDGNLEIIAANYQNEVFVFDYMGNILPGWPVNLATDIFASASVYDYTGDGKSEIVIATKADTDPLDNGAIFLLDSTGQVLPGFPVITPNQVYSVPALADMDGDGIPEIIYGFGDYSDALGPKGVMVMDMRSRPLEGWPVTVANSIYGTIALGDLNNDDYPEIVVATQKSEVYALTRDGKNMPGFPVTVSSNPDSTIFSSPAIADIDNSGQPEILVSSEVGFRQDAYLHMIKANGSMMPFSPVQLQQIGFPSPCIADLDNNGTLEILIADTTTTVFNLNTPFDLLQQYWPTYHGNNASTGVYAHDTALATGVNLLITGRTFSGGQTFLLDAVMTNADANPHQNVSLFIILDVYSMYWFYPSWSETVDWYSLPSLDPGFVHMNILTFEWPSDITGSADNLFFWGGMLDQNSNLLGDIGYVVFGYGL